MKLKKIKLYFNNFGDVNKYIGDIEVMVKKEPITEDDIHKILEYVYRQTQNIDDSWSKKYNLSDQRSTSIGDYMIFNGVRYNVAVQGFTKKPIKNYIHGTY
tara:strand:- start:15 stop:317 length:303 start_codon:yes stop_codon:yes gene_type:complete